MQAGEGKSWRYVDPAILEDRDAVVLHTVHVRGVGSLQDRKGVTICRQTQQLAYSSSFLIVN